MKCSIECDIGVYLFHFDNGVFHVSHVASSIEELFEKIQSFRTSFKNLECDLSLTSEQEGQSKCLSQEYAKAERKEKDKVKGRYAKYIVGLCGS